MSNIDVEKREPLELEQPQSNSDVTLTNTPTLQSKPSRESSIERPQKGQMGIISKGASTTHRYLYQEFDSAWTTSIIVICFLTSGLIDSVAFNSWSCFVGMQTGNTIFAALGIGGQPRVTHPRQYYKSLVSIGAFTIGSLFFNALHRSPTGITRPTTCRRRIIFVVSFFIQTMLVVISTLLVTLHYVSNQPAVAGRFSSGTSISEPGMETKDNYLDLCPVALLAFEAAGQVCVSRVLLLGDLPTIVLSTLYHDFAAAMFETLESWRKAATIKDFLFIHERRQFKRIISIIALFLGGVIGGEMYKSSAGMAGALWFAAGLKGACTIAFLLWPKDPSEGPTLPY